VLLLSKFEFTPFSGKIIAVVGRNISECNVMNLLLLEFIYEGEKNHKKGGLNCVFGNFFFYVLDNCPQVQCLK